MVCACILTWHLTLVNVCLTVFGLFGLSNCASSMIGPSVIQAIINKTGNNWMGFPFLFAICTAASLIIWFTIDVEKGRQDSERWAEDRTKAT